MCGGGAVWYARDEGRYEGLTGLSCTHISGLIIASLGVRHRQSPISIVRYNKHV